MRSGDAMRRACAACGGIVLMAATMAAASADTLQQRGAYLVTTIGACGNCHTPRNAAGRPEAGMALAGGYSFDTHEPGIGVVTGPNITPDKETGIGNWSTAQ